MNPSSCYAWVMTSLDREYMIVFTEKQRERERERGCASVEESERCWSWWETLIERYCKLQRQTAANYSCYQNAFQPKQYSPIHWISLTTTHCDKVQAESLSRAIFASKWRSALERISECRKTDSLFHLTFADRYGHSLSFSWLAVTGCPGLIMSNYRDCYSSPS